MLNVGQTGGESLRGGPVVVVVVVGPGVTGIVVLVSGKARRGVA